MAAISSLGVGSGLDLGSLLSNLLESERAPVANRLAIKEQNYTTELSAFGLLRSSLSQFQNSLDALQNADAYNAKSIGISDSSVLSATVDNSAETGSYSIEVTAIAKTQSLATNAATAFATIGDTIGTGTLDIQFGTTTTGPYSFTADPTKSPQSIVVSSANNNTTLSGLRDYINENDYGVQASIVNDGNGYRLLLTSEDTGASNSMEITVSGDGDGNDNNNSGLSQLAFNASAQTSLTQTVAAQDAALTINGLDITSDTNNIDDAISGVSLDLLKADVGNLVNVSINETTSGITASINAFVEAYNQLDKSIDSLTSYDPETGNGSALVGDFTVRSISSQIRNVIFGSIADLSSSSDIKTLVDLGITTNSSGSLNVDSSKLQDALQNSADEVRALFSQSGSTTDAGIGYVSATSETVPGDYAIELTQVLTQGAYTGTGPVNSLTVNNSNNRLRLTVDGINTGNFNLTSATYASEADLANHIQTRINSRPNLIGAGVSVTVTHDVASDSFVITSDSLGPSSTVEITRVDPNTFADFGLALGVGVDGTDTGFTATIDGVSASVNGSIVSSQSGDSKGLSVEVLTSGFGARGSVSVGNGLAGKLDSLLKNFLESDGFIASREESINDGIEDIADERIRLDDRIAALEARLIRQFSALDALVAQFNQTSNFLTQQLASLPKPNSINSGN